VEYATNFSDELLFTGRAIVFRGKSERLYAEVGGKSERLHAEVGLVSLRGGYVLFHL
jgi:hypothetical protein